MIDRLPKVHELKSWPEFFQPIFDGHKRFELRRSDRDYRVKDVLLLKEYEPRSDTYTGRNIIATVTYVMDGVGPGCIQPLVGLHRGYCILGIDEIERADAGVRDEQKW